MSACLLLGEISFCSSLPCVPGTGTEFGSLCTWSRVAEVLLHSSSLYRKLSCFGVFGPGWPCRHWSPLKVALFLAMANEWPAAQISLSYAEQPRWSPPGTLSSIMGLSLSAPYLCPNPGVYQMTRDDSHTAYSGIH